MHEIISFVENHPVYVSTAIAGFWWVLASFMSTAAPLPPNAGWWATSIHNFLQFVSANHGKLSFNQVPTTQVVVANPTLVVPPK